jgi:acyl-coenzyme A thioesterase PaaI-like protein
MRKNQHPATPSDFPSRQASPDFVRDFLFGQATIEVTDQHIRSCIAMDQRTEGWVGIPHGGISMGAVMDLALLLYRKDAASDSLYPLSVDFRMGGASIRTGDHVMVDVSPVGGGASGFVTVDKDVSPYLSAAIAFGKDDFQKKEVFSLYLPASISMPEHHLTPLPCYKNCFVCGTKRLHPGLGRRFYLLDADAPEKIIISSIGFDASDRNSFYLFHRQGMVHPLAFLALLDENMGWAGFMATASGGVTVRISYTFYRNIAVGERVVVFGRGEKVKGNPGSRQLFWASGGAAVVKDDGRLEVVIAASGQWLGIPDLTDQMRRELLPEEQNCKAFALAGR